MSTNDFTWAVVGGGHGGQAMAAHIALEGCRVRLYDIFQEKVDVINEQGGIFVDGEVNGFGQIEFATTDIEKVLKDADIINIVVPANAHRILARQFAPFLRDGQIIVLHPGSSFGCLEFKEVLRKEGCEADVTLAETYTLIYAARSNGFGKSSILGLKKDMGFAALPATRINEVLPIMQEVFPFLSAEKNVLATSLKNVNPIVHPIPYLLNTSRIDSREDFLFYYEGYTPAIGAFVEREDRERIALGKAFGLQLKSMKSIYHDMYKNITGDSMYDIVKNNPAYAEIKGQKTIETRYLLEDIPFSLYPWVSVGKHIGLNLDIMETVVNFACLLLDKNLKAEARDVEALGISGMSKDNIIEYVETGVKPREIIHAV